MTGRARYLAPGERLVMEVRRHIAALAKPGLSAIAAVVGAAAIGFITSPRDEGHLIDTLVGLVAVVFSLRLAWRVWEWGRVRPLPRRGRLQASWFRSPAPCGDPFRPCRNR